MKFKPSKMTNKELDNRMAILTAVQVVIGIIMICLGLIMLSNGAKAECSEIYLKVGAGYKFSETDQIKTKDGKKFDVDNSPVSARIEIGKESGNVTYGISHHSQWLSGWPVNDQGEYGKTEVFIDFKFSPFGG